MPTPDEVSEKRREHLEELRAGVLDEMEAADGELSRLRMRVERMESDLRLGAEPGDDYEQIKGHAMTQTEARLIELYRELLKIEDKIRGKAAILEYGVERDRSE